MNLIKTSLIILLIQSALTAKTQEFAPIGAEWYYSEGFFSWTPIVEDYIKLTSVKDTTINGISCRKIIKSRKFVCQNRPNEEFVYSNNDTVFFYDLSFDEFQILYIRQAEPDDKWNIKILDELNNTFTIEVKVDSVNTIQINNKSLKKLFVTYKREDQFMQETYSSIIIDNIGDTQYMFNWNPWSTFACDGNFSKGLRCYIDSEFGHYSTGIADSCDSKVYWTNLNKITENDEIKIFPNPTKDFVEVRVKGDSYLLELYDIQGRLLLSKRMNTNDILDLKSIEKGVYLLTLKDKSNVLTTRRLIKE
jgi:hypothetical protein